MNVASYRVVAHAPATIRWQPVDQDGEAVAATGTPSAVVTRADGTAITPTIAIVAGVVELGLTAAQTATLDRLSVSWLLDAVVRGTSTVDVVGGVFATLAEIRTGEPTLSDVNADTDVALRRARDEVESTIDRATNHVLSFVRRFDTAVIQQTYRSPLTVPHYFARSVTWARYEQTAGTWTTLDITGGVTLRDGYWFLNSGAWPSGRVQVGYEHGLDAPPADVRRAAIAAVRQFASRARSPIDARTMSYTNGRGETQRFATPGLGPWITGVPEIDEVLSWYRKHYPVVMVA